MWRLTLILFFLIPVRGGPPTGSPALPKGVIDGAPTVIDCAPPITDCAPAATAFLHPDAAGHYAPVFPGWGHHHYPISTSVDSAQFYFDQGLSLYYSFHLSEAAASFKEATVKDSGCAMAYWGEALAMGPFYNSTYTYRMPREVLPVLDRMNELSASATAKEREMIAALDRRYSTDISDRRRSQLNQAWSSAMAVLTRKFPDDNDIAALYIDGMMTQHAWDLWDPQGRPKPWTPALVSLCEKILARDPDHPAALHYHIHLLEASLHPEATLESANRLKDMMPGVPHMVHMASHSYQRTGLYAKGVSINDAANAAQTNYSELAPQLHLHPTVIHYDAVEAFCAMNAGMYEKAMTSALRCRSAILSRPGVPNANAQYLSMMPVFVQLRLGKWDAVLDERLPDRTWVFASLLGDFARGMAYLRTGKMAEASACLDSIRSHQNEPFLAAPIPPSNTPVKVAAVAEEILAGEILFAAGKPNAALTAFQHAIDSEDALTCLEPKDWALPARQYAGACCLKLGRVGEAEKLYREDLVQNPGNGWALLGLARTAEAQHKDAASSDYLTRAKATFAKAEEMPGASAY